jgi:hypothetical protein
MNITGISGQGTVWSQVASHEKTARSRVGKAAINGSAKRSTVIVLFSGFSFPNTGGKIVSGLALSAACLSE